MALILKYRVDPPQELNEAVFKALAAQVGQISINIRTPLVSGAAVIGLTGDFIEVAGEHSNQRELRTITALPEQIVDIVLKDLTGHTYGVTGRGMSQEWDRINPEIQSEIRQTLVRKVGEIL